MLLQLLKPPHDHVLPCNTTFGKFVDARNKMYVLDGCRMHNWSVKHSKRLRLDLHDALNINFEHASKLRPQSHTNTIMVEVEHWNFVALLHDHLELFV